MKIFLIIGLMVISGVALLATVHAGALPTTTHVAVTDHTLLHTITSHSVAAMRFATMFSSDVFVRLVHLLTVALGK